MHIYSQHKRILACLTAISILFFPTFPLNNIPDSIEEPQEETPPQEGEETPGMPNGNEDEKPGDGEDEKPGEGEDEKPGEGEDEKPGEGEDEKPGEGEDEKPGEGEEEKPGEGEVPGDSVQTKLHYSLLIQESGYEPVKLEVDSSLRLKVTDGCLLASDLETDSVSFEISNLAEMRYIPYFRQEEDLGPLVSVERTQICPEVSLTPTEITITNASELCQHFYIHRLDGSMAGKYIVANSVTVSLNEFSSGIYIISGGNISPIKFIIR